MTGRCIHCGAPLAPPRTVCPSCEDLLSDLGEYDDDYEPPPPRGVTLRSGRYEPSADEVRCYEELSGRGSFRPLCDVKPKAPPSWSKSKWGKAVAAEWQRDPGPIS